MFSGSTFVCGKDVAVANTYEDSVDKGKSVGAQVVAEDWEATRKQGVGILPGWGKRRAIGRPALVWRFPKLRLACRCLAHGVHGV
eukprot:12124477-Prorocentrum_lima.AAC.1